MFIYRKNHDNQNLSWKQRYDELELYHVQETKILIEHIKVLEARLNAMDKALDSIVSCGFSI